MLNDFKKLAKESYAKNHKAKMLNFERDAIVKTLRECNYNISEASKWLGYSRQHMYKKMKALGIRVIGDEGNRGLRGYRRKIDFLQAPLPQIYGYRQLQLVVAIGDSKKSKGGLNNLCLPRI